MLTLIHILLWVEMYVRILVILFFITIKALLLLVTCFSPGYANERIDQLFYSLGSAGVVFVRQVGGGLRTTDAHDEQNVGGLCHGLHRSQVDRHEPRSGWARNGAAASGS